MLDLKYFETKVCVVFLDTSANPVIYKEKLCISVWHIFNINNFVKPLAIYQNTDGPHYTKNMNVLVMFCF